MNDWQLVQRAVQSPEAYAYIIERYEKPLLRFVQNLSQLSYEDAEDIVQQVFIKAYGHLNDFDPELKLSSWLFRIARNEVISFWRYKKVRPQESELNEEIMNETSDEIEHAKLLDNAFLAKEVQSLLALLQPEYREVLYLYYFEDKNYDEIADIIRSPVGTVAALLSRAKKAFSDLAKRVNRLEALTMINE